MQPEPPPDAQPETPPDAQPEPPPDVPRGPSPASDPGLLATAMRLLVALMVMALGAILVTAGLPAVLAPASPGTGGGSPAATMSGAPASPSAGAGGSVAPSPLPSGADPVLVGAGDIVSCDGTDDKATAALVERTPGIVFTLGDNTYDEGTSAQFQDCYGPSWGRFLDRTRFAVAGNHDYLTDHGAPFKAYFGSAAVRDGVTWFSEDVGTWHVIVLDANCAELTGGCGPDSPEVQWLRADLAASTARCTVALWHQPRFSSGLHGNDPVVGPFWDALYAAGADLVLNGHDHDYERFAPQSPSGAADPSRGITEMVVGTGGAPLRAFGPEIANDVVRSSFAHGVVALTLHPSGWSFQFVSTDGSFSDQGRGTCH